MIKFSTLILTIFGLLIIVTGCERPECKNSNPIFNRYTLDTKEYKDELVKQFANIDKSKLTYWVDTFIERDNAPYIQVHVQGDGLCAKFVLVVNDSKKGIEKLLKNKGRGYSGAELKDLKFSIRQNVTSTEFVFQEISGIKD